MDDRSLLDHSIPIKYTFVEFILTIMSRQDIKKMNFPHFLDNLASKEHMSALEYGFSILNVYAASVDIHATRAIFSAALRHKMKASSMSLEFLKELVDYEMISSLKSDSQVISVP